MTREESLQILHSVYEDIKNMTEEDIEDFNNTVREYKKEQIMTKKEAIATLENIRNVPSMFIDETIKDLVEAFKQPPTLAEILGWEEGQEYEHGLAKYKLENGRLMEYYDEPYLKGWAESRVWFNNIGILRQAKKVEQRPKAYHVKDEYSYGCLIKELEEQGYVKALFFGKYSPAFPIIYINSDGEYDDAQLGSQIAEMCDIVEYHKEEPRYLLQTDLTSENGIQYLSFDRNRRKYFIGALIASDNVQQRFTDDEISKIKLITRFAKLCKKIEVE